MSQPVLIPHKTTFNLTLGPSPENFQVGTSTPGFSSITPSDELVTPVYGDENRLEGDASEGAVVDNAPSGSVDVSSKRRHLSTALSMTLDNIVDDDTINSLHVPGRGSHELERLCAAGARSLMSLFVLLGRRWFSRRSFLRTRLLLWRGHSGSRRRNRNRGQDGRSFGRRRNRERRQRGWLRGWRIHYHGDTRQGSVVSIVEG